MEGDVVGVKIKGYVGSSAMSDVDRDALLHYLPSIGVVVEIGTFSGVTVAWLADKRPDLRFISVDPFRKAEGTGAGVPANWIANRRPNTWLFVGTMPELVEMFPGFHASTVIVDGDHGYDGCVADLVAACKVTERILVHDYGRVEKHLRAVTKATDDFCTASIFHVTDRRGTVALLSEVK